MGDSTKCETLPFDGKKVKIIFLLGKERQLEEKLSNSCPLIMEYGNEKETKFDQIFSWKKIQVRLSDFFFIRSWILQPKKSPNLELKQKQDEALISKILTYLFLP